jgi:copper chaperone NosL
MTRSRAFGTIAAGALALLAAGCAIEPQPVHYGAVECDRCRMVVSDPGFAAQALTRKGKAHTFDSVECLAAFLGEARVAADALHSAWVQDFDEPDRWLAADDAVYVLESAVRSPMGAGLTAHASAEAARAHASRHGGRVAYWEGVAAHGAASGSHGHAH